MAKKEKDQAEERVSLADAVRELLRCTSEDVSLKELQAAQQEARRALDASS